MKPNKITSLAALVLASLTVAQAATITAWTFDNNAVAVNNSPTPVTGSGTATVLGMNNTYNSTTSANNADVLSSTGSSTGASGPLAWRVRGTPGNGWSTQAPIGTQGAEFDASTAGFNNIQISFDINTTAQAEANLLLQYTIDGSSWLNAPLSSAGSLGSLQTASGANTVNSAYVKLGSTAGWNNLITADLSGISTVNNNASFGIRIVNASTGADDLNISGAAYNNTSGNWRYDNVIISGTAAVPEPSSLALGGVALAGIALLRRTRKA